MLVCSRRRKLPWQSLMTSSRETKCLREMKQTISEGELCGDLSTEFAECMNYVQNLVEEEDWPSGTY